MKKATLIAVLISMMTISAQAQWFDFSENMNRGTIGFNSGLVGYHSVSDLANGSTWTFTDVGVGLSLSLFGAYVDFLYVTPDHMYDSYVVLHNWDDHDAFVINLGYQIPIYKDYVFITPIIGWSRVSTGYTIGNNIHVDPENHSIYHKYYSTWHRNDLNYGGILTGCPLRWLDINLGLTAHAAYAGIGINIGGIKQ